MNKTLQTLEIKVENNGATPQGKIFAREWNVLVEAVKALDLKEFDEAKLLQFLRDNDFITSEDIPDVDFSNVVTLSGQQTISGAKDFVGGLSVNGMPIVYDPVKKAWEFKGDFVVTGAITMFGSLSGFQPSTVTEAVEVDGETIVKTKNSQGQWQLTAIGGGSGSGGGISAAEVNILISNALEPYALSTSIPTDNKQLFNGAGYATVSDLDTRINNLINGAPAAYDTLKEIADVLAGNVNSIGDILTALDTKATKTYVDAELAKYVKLATAQSIEAQHNFVNGLQIGGLPITKSASANNTIYLDANLVVSGAITMFGSGSTTFPTIWANIPFNLEHLSWDGSQWNVIVEGGSGSGSLDTNAVNVLISEYLTQNSYATISDISSSLVGYATQSWVGDNAAKYIGAASVDSARHAIGYDNLSMGSVDLPTAGGFISADQGNYGFQILGSTLGDNLYWRGINGGNLGNWTKILDSDNIGEYALLPSGGTMKEGSGLYNEADQDGYGAIGFNSTHNAFGSPLFPTKLRSSIDPTLQMGSSEFTLIHSGNIGQQSVSRAASAGAADSVSVTPVTESGNYSLALLPSSSTRTQGVCVGNNHRALFNPSTGTLTATSFVGNLTGNADSATKLATPRTIWGQSFDGTGNISGLLTNVDGIRGSTTDGGYIGDRNKGLGATDGGSMIYNYSSSPITFHIAGSEYMRITNGGNVAIGGTTADAKLHVHGNTMVDGEFYINNKTILRLDNSNAWVNYGGANDGLDLRLCGRELIFQYGRGDAFARAMTITSGGNVAIGGAFTPIAKFHVAGTGLVTEHFSVGANLAHANIDRAELSIVSQGDAPTDLMFGYNGTRKWSITSRSATSSEAKGFGLFNYESDSWSWVIGVDNNMTIHGNLLATGAITMFSQASMKNIINREGLDLEQLAMIQPARFTWKDGRDSPVHVGGIADEVMQVLPEVVHRTSNEKLTMDYGSAGFFVAASLIKPVIDHEKRIADLERENKELKQQIEQLSA